MSEPRAVEPRRVVSAHRAVQVCGGLALLGASLFASPRCMGAGSFTVLHSFAGGAADGAFPATGVILDGSGYLYGTSGGGSSNLERSTIRTKPNWPVRWQHSKPTLAILGVRGSSFAPRLCGQTTTRSPKLVGLRITELSIWTPKF